MTRLRRKTYRRSVMVRVEASAFQLLKVNDVELTVEGQIPSGRRHQALLLVRSPAGKQLLARCLRTSDEHDIGWAQVAASSVYHELNALRAVDRPELPRVYEEWSGPARLSNEARSVDVLVVVRDFIEGQSVDERLRNLHTPNLDQVRLVVPWLESVLRALIALHAKNVGHFDLRAANVIHPDEQGKPVVVIDLNSSQVLSVNEASRHTILQVDQRLAPEAWYRARADRAGRIDLAKLSVEEPLAWLDWYQFGLLTREMTSAATNLDATHRRYLDEVADYLTSYPGCMEIKAKEIRRLLERAKPEFLHPYGVPELVRNARNIDVEVFPDGQVFTKVGVLGEIVKHPAFTRLFEVKQLTLLRYVFVGAEHSRAMHMMHCASLTADLLKHLFSEPRFLRTFDSKDIRFAIVAALLHDINHFPFLHTFQESAKSIFTNRALFDEVMESDFSHFTGEQHIPLRELLIGAAIDPEALWRVIFGERYQLRQYGPIEQFVNSMIDSGVDVDKLSYLYLDALCTGVPVGQAIDYSRLMRSAIMVPDLLNMESLAFDIGALPAVESVIHARLANFRAIYWHQRNRALMAMFLHVADNIDYTRLDETTLRREVLVSSEADVVRRMNELYEEHTGRRSPMAMFIPLRGAGLFEQLYQVPVTDDREEGFVFRRLSAMSRAERSDRSGEAELRRALADELMSRYPRLGEVDIAEILIDIPARPMDGQLVAFLRDGRGEPKEIDKISSTAEAAVKDFQKLAKSIRVFVSPRVASTIGIRGGEPELRWIGGLLYEILSGLPNGSNGRLS
ncbi:hypothetical protein ABZ783_24650 [Micromonospora sp. NPDC047738]|uniref:hypothetical protein n=1 Tax=Micromonospora sp. NPDC047738 TaxID=3155741 RepID=UPI0033CB4F8D